MPRIDLHQHLWPEAFVAELSRRRQPPFLKDGRLILHEGRFALRPGIGDPVACVEALDRDRIEVAVVSLQPTLGTGGLPTDERNELESAWIEGTQELVGASGGRLLAFAPDRALPGFVGASVQARAFDDFDSVAPVLDELERRSQPLFVHPGSAPPSGQAPEWWASVVDYTAQMQRAYFRWLVAGRRRWPTLRVIFALLAGGAPFQLERLGQRGRDVRSTLDDNVYLDVATYGRRSIELCVETFGVKHLVYGSDRPLVDPAQTLRSIRGFGESVEKLVCADNPATLWT